MVIRELLNLWDRNEMVKVLSHYMMVSPSHLYAHQDEEVLRKVEELSLRAIRLRKKGYPLQYILGTWGFYTIDLKVAEGVLIPRPETEMLVDEALHILQDHDWEKPKVLDIGYGTGAISLSIAKHAPDAQVYGTDISVNAFMLAQENAKNLGLHHVHFYLGNLFENVDQEKFHIIVSNPPYISQEEKPYLQEELRYEPEIALFAPENGLALYNKMVPLAMGHLEEGGFLLLEIGAKQGELVSMLLQEAGFENVHVKQDLNGHDRVVMGRKGVVA